MKKKGFVIAGCIMLILLSTSAYGEEEKGYIDANFGLGFFSDSSATNQITPGLNYDIKANKGFAVGAAIGRDFYGFPRIEGEIAYQSNGLDKAVKGSRKVTLHEDIDSLAFLVNGYWDFKNDSLWTPYLSAGLGGALINVDDNSSYVGNDYAGVFAYQVGCGLAYAVDENLTIDIKYRYFATSNPKFKFVEMEYATQNVYVGMRYSF